MSVQLCWESRFCTVDTVILRSNEKHVVDLTVFTAFIAHRLKGVFPHVLEETGTSTSE